MTEREARMKVAGFYNLEAPYQTDRGKKYRTWHKQDLYEHFFTAWRKAENGTVFHTSFTYGDIISGEVRLID